MNFLADILATADAAELEDLNCRVQEFTEVISNLKTDVSNVIEGTYVTFRPVLIDHLDMGRKAETLNQDLTELLSRVEIQISRDPSNTTSDLSRLKQALDEQCVDLNFINSLLSFHTNLIEAKRNERNTLFLECSKKYRQLKQQILHEETLKSFSNYQRLCGELRRFYSRAALRTLQEWQPLISWSVIDLDLDKQKSEISLKINTITSKEQLINALYNFDLLSLEVEKFSKQLLNNTLLPIIDKLCKILVTSSGDTLMLSTCTKTKPVGKRKPCIDVLNELIVAFQFIYSHLDVEIGETGSQTTFITELGEEIGDDFCDHLIEHCLEEAVPKNVEDLEHFSKIIKKMTELDDLLHEKGFLSNDNNKLKHYKEDVKILMTDRISQCYLMKAKSMMKADLFDIMDAGVKDKANKKTFYDEIANVDQISESSFEFPHMKISKSADGILHLIEKMLKEATSNSSKMITRTLYLRARHIIKMYCDLSPFYHKHVLDTNPQYSAFFYNNCQYLAHRLTLLARKYKEPLSIILDDEIVVISDLIPVLTSTGAQALRNQLNAQKRKIIDTLGNSGLITLMDSKEIPSSIEESICQICRQFSFLQSLWENVLSNATYCKALGYLCNACVEDLTRTVCSYSSIDETSAKHLIHVFNIVEKKLTSIFEDPQDIVKNVKLWLKFKEIIKFLGADLNEVEARWENGKGPLAQEFTAQEVKKLIRAAFSGSIKRASILAAIQ
ncbi:hypothetical protein LSTR_LSTR007551 [Laodelphax striatellus]|uniref:Centromere/kinetochore protein zw10 n=1 Tax=Laodelphax striatellus TaxID=195883 RepID=A0A482XRS2_LAOST|nr:hypothetical protein LSTR_LSTR007551 [Laodelphax striatellus]